MNSKIIAIGISVVAVVIAALAFFTTGSGARPLGNTTQSFWDSAGGYKVDGIAIVTGAGIFTPQAGTLSSYSSATSSPGTAQTLTESDIAFYDTILMTPTVGALTLTLPGAATLTTYLPATGDMARQCWVNATTTAAATLIFAAGSGIDLETASSSPTDLTVLAGETACFTFIRTGASAVSADMIEYTNGD